MITDSYFQALVYTEPSLVKKTLRIVGAAEKVLYSFGMLTTVCTNVSVPHLITNTSFRTVNYIIGVVFLVHMVDNNDSISICNMPYRRHDSMDST
jgi:hypothetical protein